MNNIDIKDLPFSSKARIVWGFFWRGIITTIGSSLCGALLGALTGAILGVTGMPQESVTIVAGVLGVGCGMFFLYLLLRWLLSTRMGSFRLVLVRDQEQVNKSLNLDA